MFADVLLRVWLDDEHETFLGNHLLSQAMYSTYVTLGGDHIPWMSSKCKKSEPTTRRKQRRIYQRYTPEKNILHPNEGLVQMIFRFQEGDFQVPCWFSVDYHVSLFHTVFYVM